MTGVHPETYPVVERILAATGRTIDALMGRAELLKPLPAERFADAVFGAVTVRDILAELEKPGRDPRGDFRVARYADGVEQLTDLRPDMVLEGTVTNVAQFGAFVDLGVHQDGLVHVSQLAHRFVRDAREVVKTGDVVRVRVLEVDLPRQRVALTMKLDAPGERGAADAGSGDANRYRPPERGQRVSAGGRGARQDAAPQGALAAAFARVQGGSGRAR
jgi:uncharacterized protein